MTLDGGVNHLCLPIALNNSEILGKKLIIPSKYPNTVFFSCEHRLELTADRVTQPRSQYARRPIDGAIHNGSTAGTADRQPEGLDAWVTVTGVMKPGYAETRMATPPPRRPPGRSHGYSLYPGTGSVASSTLFSRVSETHISHFQGIALQKMAHLFQPGRCARSNTGGQRSASAALTGSCRPLTGAAAAGGSAPRPHLRELVSRHHRMFAQRRYGSFGQNR